MRGNKRVLSFVMAFLMLFTMFFTQAGVARAAESKLSGLKAPKKGNLGTVQAQKKFEGKSLKVDPKTDGLKDSDKVRIIVELNEKPVIEYATAKGVKISGLNKSTIKTVTDKLVSVQATLKNEIKKSNINIKYHQSFVNVANGFSATTTFGEAKKIEAMPNVEKVSIANEYFRPEPNMTTSKDIVNAVETWDLGYNGEGMVVSVIDTGIDPSHRDMVLTNNGAAKLTKDGVNAVIAAQGLKGKWYTDKVPYGYNYYDNNDIILDLGPDASMHGMHVSGTVGANGDEENGGIKGVAPEAQILGMKVFSNDPNFPSTFSDIYISAIEDSIKLGADVINMSLGSTASFQRMDDPEQVALTRATENGIVLSISAGNSNHIGDGYSDPYAKNPDIGVVGTPGLNKNGISVASVENTKITASALEYVYTDEVTYKAGYMGSGPDAVETFKGQKLEYVNCGLGGDEEFPAEVAGKIALIQRGTYDFVTKISNAQKHGAIGVIVYNHAAGGEGMVSMMYPGDGKIPAVFITNSNGVKLVELISTGANFVEFKGNTTQVANPSAGKMSDFTSWGTTPNLDFKPELTAPGGNIYSTFNNNKYGLMSGTSMAAPHVAGGSALVLQRVIKDFGLEGSARVQMAKNILMSTAKPLTDSYGYMDSPRRQGAGVMDLYGATTTPAIVVDKSTGISKVNLKDFTESSKTYALTVKNFGDTPITYAVQGNVITDFVQEVEGVKYNTTTTEFVLDEDTGLEPIYFTDNSGNAIEQIVVPAKGSVDFNVKVDLSKAYTWYLKILDAATFPAKGSYQYVPEYITNIFENGSFIEGFVKLTDVSDTHPALSIPYMGFYGEWDKAPILDDNNYDIEGTPFYGVTTMTWLDKQEGEFYFLGYDFDGNADKNNIAFSPNGDGKADNVRLLGSLMRNAAELQVNILGKDGSLLRVLAKDYDLRKNFFDGGRGAYFTANDSWEWDGKINNKLAPEGEYIYQVKAKIDYEGAEWQTFNFPIKIDNTKPVVEVNFDRLSKKLTVEANDNNKVNYYQLFNGNDKVDENSTGIFDLSSFADGKYNLTVKTYDFAENVTVTEKEVVLSNDFDIPHIFVESPEVLGIYNTNQVLVKGYVTDASEIREIKVFGEALPLTYNAETKEYTFEKTLTLNDGVHRIRFEATDIAGNTMNFERKLWVDTKAPVIDASVPTLVKADVDKINVTATITDNFPALNVYVNGNIEYNSHTDWEFVQGENPTTYNLAYEVSLQPGENTIVIEAKDDAGNVTTKELTVYRDMDAPVVEVTSPAANASVEGSKVVVSGKVTDNKGIGNLKVNGKDVTVDAEGNFTTEVVFSDYGTKSIEVVAVDVAGNSTSKTVNVMMNIPHVTSISVTQDKTEIERGQTATFKAEATYSDGTKVEVTNTAAWTAGNGSIANGAFTAPANFSGDVKVTAKLEGVEGTATIKVKVPTVVSISVTQDKTELERGQTATFKAEATYSDGTKADVTNTAAWTAEKGSVANGTFTAPSNLSGDVKVTAKLEGVEGTATIKVKVPTVVSIAVKQDKTELERGQTATFNAEATYSDGSKADVSNNATWTAEKGSIANGAFTAPSDFTGVVKVTAKFDGIEASATINVKDPVVVKTYIQITASRLNVRTGPSTRYRIIGVLVKGQVVEYTALVNGWYKIVFNGKVAYVSGRYAKVVQQSITSAPTSGTNQVTVTASYLNVRRGAGVRYARIGVLRKGTVVTVLGKLGSWYKIDYNGRTGYISSRYTK